MRDPDNSFIFSPHASYIHGIHTVYGAMRQHLWKSSENILKACLDITQGFYKYEQRQRLGRTTVRVLTYSVTVLSVWSLYTAVDQY